MNVKLDKFIDFLQSLLEDPNGISEISFCKLTDLCINSEYSEDLLDALSKIDATDSRYYIAMDQSFRDYLPDTLYD